MVCNLGLDPHAGPYMLSPLSCADTVRVISQQLAFLELPVLCFNFESQFHILSSFWKMTQKRNMVTKKCCMIVHCYIFGILVCSLVKLYK